MPSFRALVIPVVIMVVFVAGAFTAYQVADIGQKDAARDQGTLVENETHVQRIGFWQLTDNSTNTFFAGANDTVTVYNNSSAVLDRGDDFEWNKTEGAIYFYDTASTNDGDPYNITYTYFTNTKDVQQVSGPLSVVTRGMGYMAYLVAGIAMVVFLLGIVYIVKSFLDNSTPTTRR